jgi:hypothetical protein
MSVVLDMYRELRRLGWKHAEACDRIALKLSVDPLTARRVLQRAEAADRKAVAVRPDPPEAGRERRRT